MYKYLAASVLGGIVGFACTTTSGPNVVACQRPLQAAPAMTMAVDLPDEHVRHMRAHNKTAENKAAEVEEASKASQVSDAAEQAKPIVDETPTGSIKRTKPRKPKLLAQKKRKITDEQDVLTEQAPPAEIESPAPRGLFDTLFHGN
jgi:FtsZ-interacting cell division protein ZipA